MSDQALRPQSFTMQSFIKEEKPQMEFTVEEEILAAGADKMFWKTLKKHFESNVEQLELMNETAIANGLPFDEIGRNALVISQVKGVLRKIINTVEDAKEAVDARPTK